MIKWLSSLLLPKRIQLTLLPRHIFFFFSVFFLVFNLFSCQSNQQFSVNSLKKRDVRTLSAIARDPHSTPIVRFSALEPLISFHRNSGDIDRLHQLLSVVLRENPHDPYGAYYLTALIEGARDHNAFALAKDYQRQLLKNYPDLEVQGASLHLLAMHALVEEAENPREAITWRENMLRHFPERIDLGLHYYFLAKDYEKIGDWDAMYQTYNNFLAYPDTVVPGSPDAWVQTRSAINFHASDKSWTVEELSDLVANVKYAVRSLNANLLSRYQAEDFFLMNWSQEISDSFTHIPMNLGTFLKSSIRYRGNLEDFSNDREAFLWTTGWTWKIPTWYLSFRRINYPKDPEINGRWEWSGIYFGERL